ncbi:MAG: hypothetical protein WAK17_08280 [Candidatus Nitrosopolaris sp.]
MQINDVKSSGYHRRKQIKDAGRRWIAKIVFSSIKRVLGEDLFSKKCSAQKAEVGLKIMLYNKEPTVKTLMVWN